MSAPWNYPNFQVLASSHVWKVLEGIYVFYGFEKARIWPNETFVQSYMPSKHLMYKFRKSKFSTFSCWNLASNPTRIYTLLAGWAKFLRLTFFGDWDLVGSWMDYQSQVPTTQSASNYQSQLENTKVNYHSLIYKVNLQLPIFLERKIKWLVGQNGSWKRNSNRVHVIWIVNV